MTGYWICEQYCISSILSYLYKIKILFLVEKLSCCDLVGSNIEVNSHRLSVAIKIIIYRLDIWICDYFKPIIYSGIAKKSIDIMTEDPEIHMFL